MSSTSATPTPHQMLTRAIQVINETQIGLMATTAADGTPRARWMSALVEHGLRRVITLSADGTRKMAELEANPHACWVFSTENFADVVNLRGQVTIHHNAIRVQDAWDRLADAVRTWAVGPLSDEEHLHLVTIETTVEHAELICPKWGMFTPQPIPLAL